MLQAMLAGVASIKAQQTQMNVIGNNLANVNTTAYKGSTVTFEDMIAQTMKGATRPTSTSGGTDPIQYGLGVQVAATSTDNQQGSLSATNRPSDLAIQGNGYFMVSNGETTYYTRDGSCDLDSNGSLVQSSTGQRLLGWTADATGKIDTTQPIDPTKSSITIPLGVMNAVQQTSTMSFGGNLNSVAAASDTWTMQSVCYDTQGGSHTLTYTFNNHQTLATAGANGETSSWDWSAVDENGTTVGGSGVGGVGDGMSGHTNTSIYFDANGKMVSTAGSTETVTVQGSGSAPSFNISLDFSPITQLNTSATTGSQVQMKDQNGYPPGSLDGYSIGSDGIITGMFTNGLTRPLAQIAVTVFPNANGLERIGDNLYRSTENSGIPNAGAPNSGGRGKVNSGFLEQSNIDIGGQLTDLIITQRGFQANTKVVTTVDEMLQDLIGMKR